MHDLGVLLGSQEPWLCKVTSNVGPCCTSTIVSAVGGGLCAEGRSGSDEQMMVPKVETKFVIRFKLSDFVRGQIPKDSTVKGTVYGDLFLSEDVAITGPRKGAMAAAEC